jgi:hypothetical protein
MWNYFDAFIQMTGIKLTRLQKVLLMVLIMLTVIGMSKYYYALIGYRIFWYTITKGMAISEIIQQIFLYPIVCMAIWRIPE